MTRIGLERRCSFYCDPTNLGIGRGFGYCGFDNCRTVCDGDVFLCAKKKRQGNHPTDQRRSLNERRTHPRFDLDLPLEYKVIGARDAFGGIAIDGSEAGLLISTPKDWILPCKLEVVVFFAKGFELACFEAFAQIRRKQISHRNGTKAYHYGLQFIRIPEEDHRKLKDLLSDRFLRETVLPRP
jgi:PilZ domain